MIGTCREIGWKKTENLVSSRKPVAKENNGALRKRLMTEVQEDVGNHKVKGIERKSRPQKKIGNGSPNRIPKRLLKMDLNRGATYAIL